MNIINFFIENSLNIVIGISTGIFSSILVSKIFLVYQDIKSDFLHVVKNTGAFKGCFIIFCTYKKDSFPSEYGVSLPTNYNNSKNETYRKIKEISWNELNCLTNIYTKYMDKELCEIIEKHTSAICKVYEECDEKNQRDEHMVKSLINLKNVLLEYNSYQKRLFNKTIFIAFTDKLILCLMAIFALFVFIA